MSKGSYKEGELKNVNTDLVQEARKPVRVGKVTGFMHRRIGSAMEICGATYRHGTVFAPKQCLYQKKL